jgi:hypothetical protein
MCTICTGWEMNRLTSKEAMRQITQALKKTKDKKKTRHLIELSGKILDKDVPMKDTDPYLDRNWHDENQKE